MNLWGRITSKIIVAEKCWLWDAGTNNDGYGMFWLDGRMQLAHRVMYSLLVGAIPEGKTLDHRCHVHGCVRPSHLRPATNKQNQEHRRGAQVNSRTGIRNVYQSSSDGRFWVQVKHNGRKYHGGRYVSAEEASVAAANLRATLFTHHLDHTEGTTHGR